MGAFAKWLLDEKQREVFDYFFANVLNWVFLAITALTLWPLGKAAMAWRFAKAYWLFWILLVLTAGGLLQLQRLFKMDLYSHHNAYVLSGLGLSGFLQVGWSAFAALLVKDFVPAANGWVVLLLYAFGVVSCYVATVVVGAFYNGAIYKFVNFALAIICFALFSIRPRLGRAAYGWFFNLF